MYMEEISTPPRTKKAKRVLDKITRSLASTLDVSPDTVTLESNDEDGTKTPVDQLVQRDLNKAIEPRHPYLYIPVSWYTHIARKYRGRKRPYIEAIHTLAYIVYRYRTNSFAGSLLWLPSDQLEDLFGLSPAQRRAVLKHLCKQGLIMRILIKGYTPWYPEDKSKSGNYLFLVPIPEKIKAITHPVKNFVY